MHIEPRHPSTRFDLHIWISDWGYTLERAALCRDGVEKDVYDAAFVLEFVLFNAGSRQSRGRLTTYSLSVVASSARTPSVHGIVSA
jgi:hypothetical protein